jgi:hypothetical protein
LAPAPELLTTPRLAEALRAWDDPTGLTGGDGDAVTVFDSAGTVAGVRPSSKAVADDAVGPTDGASPTVWSAGQTVGGRQGVGPAASGGHGVPLGAGLPSEGFAWVNALSAPGRAAGAVSSNPASLRLPPRSGLASESRSLAVSEQAPVTFDPASGWLEVWGNGRSDTIREAMTPDGFLDITLAGRLHSSDPASDRFDPALAGAGRGSLAGIRLVGGHGNASLLLTSQTLARGLAVQTDGPLMVTGAVRAAGPVAVAAPTITVYGSLDAPAVDLVSPGLVNVASAGAVDAGQINVTAGVFINAGQVHADGLHGGQVIIQSGNVLQGGRLGADGTAADGGTVAVAFTGAYIATESSVASADGTHGGRVTIDGGETGRLFSSGTQEALGRTAPGGTVTLRGRDVTLVGATGGGQGSGLVDPHPTRAGAFGFTVTPLSNGNVVVTNPYDDFVAADAGAVYLFQGQSGALLGCLVGSGIGDRLGDAAFVSRGPGGTPPGPDVDLVGQAVVPLTNGNYVVLSPGWNEGRGAATWGDGTAGVTGVVDDTNSLVGTSPYDTVGYGAVPLNNGNYVVRSPFWNERRGAVTWGDGSAGVTGAVDASNSLVGTDPEDVVSFGGGVTALSNGNYVVGSPAWNGQRGAATWGDGTAGVKGAIDVSNSLVGTNPGDLVAFDSQVALSNGNYVVSSERWNGNRGAVTWGDGTTGITGTIDASNSLVGTQSGDLVGTFAVVPLANGNYVVNSPAWNGARGAVTWGESSVGVRGAVDASNSLVGSQPNDEVGIATPLANGNYVVASQFWNGLRGAATWADGTTGITGTVDPSNSLVGTNPGDKVGIDITALTNGNYVVRSPAWNGQRGAATWGNGTTGITGAVDVSNSLVGTSPNDAVSFGAITPLANGNYVVDSPFWNGNRSAVTWGDGTAGVTGAVDGGNSLIGTDPSDQVGADGITALRNGNYVVDSPFWHGGLPNGLGAVTWGDGTAGVTGAVDASNSLVGNHPGDRVGFLRGVTALTNGNYVVLSPWNGGRGAVTWADGMTGITGTIDTSNSLVGVNPGDVGGSLTALSNGNYVVGSSGWNGGAFNGMGAVTWGDGTAGITGTIDASNSLVGTSPGDQVGFLVAALTNGNYVVGSRFWNGRLGAATWADGTAGVTGTIDSSNSLVGTEAGDLVGYGITALTNGNYVVGSPFWHGQRGAATWGDGSVGTTGPVDDTNSLVG